MGTGQEHLNFAASTVVDPWLKKSRIQRENDSVLLYNGWATTTNSKSRMIEEAPINGGVDFGGEAIFRIDKSKFQLGPCRLFYTLSALSAGAGTSTINRWVPFVGYHAIEHVTVKYSVNEIDRWLGEELFLYHRMFKGIRDGDSINELVLGDKSPSQRNQLAASSNRIRVDLPLAWTVDPRKYLIVAGLASQIEIRVKFRPLSHCVQTDNASNLPTGSISDIRLKTTNVHVQKQEKAIQQARIQREKKGLLYLVDRWEEQQNNIVSSGSTSTTVTINTFKGAATELFFVVRPASADDHTAANLANDPYDFVKITSWDLKAGQITLVDLLTDAEQKHILNRKLHSGVPGDHIYGASWSVHPEDQMNSWGHMTFAAMNNPTLTINFDSAISGTHYVDVYLRTKNIMHHHGGEIRTLFN